jgi:hypothetical protein
MFFALFCILPQETTLQIETGRQRDPKESWREETHRSFYPHTQGLLHREVFTLRCFCRQTSRSFYSQKFLHEEVFTQRAFYTQTRLHTEAFTQKPLHRGAFTHKSVYTQQAFTHAGAFTQRSLYTEELFTHRRFYTEKSLL